MLRQLYENLSKMIKDAEDSGDLEEAERQKSLLKKVDEQLKNKNDERRFVKFGVKNKSDFKAMTELSITKLRKDSINSN